MTLSPIAVLAGGASLAILAIAAAAIGEAAAGRRAGTLAASGALGLGLATFLLGRLLPGWHGHLSWLGAAGLAVAVLACRGAWRWLAAGALAAWLAAIAAARLLFA